MNKVFLLCRFLLSPLTVFWGALLYLWMNYMIYVRLDFSRGTAIDILVGSVILIMLVFAGIWLGVIISSHLMLMFKRRKSTAFVDPPLASELIDIEMFLAQWEQDDLDSAKFRLEQDLLFAEEKLAGVLGEKPITGLDLEVTSRGLYSREEVRAGEILRLELEIHGIKMRLREFT